MEEIILELITHDYMLGDKSFAQLFYYLNDDISYNNHNNKWYKRKRDNNNNIVWVQISCSEVLGELNRMIPHIEQSYHDIINRYDGGTLTFCNNYSRIIKYLQKRVNMVNIMLYSKIYFIDHKILSHEKVINIRSNHIESLDIEPFVQSLDPADPISIFILSNIQVTNNKKDKIKATDLNKLFNEYLKVNGLNISKVEFKKAMIDAGVMTTVSRGHMYYEGVELVENDQ